MTHYARERKRKIAEDNCMLVSENRIPKSYTHLLVNNCSLFKKYENYSDLSNVLILNQPSDSVALYATNSGFKNVIVFNFANKYHPGGGYLHGDSAQEEDLCRCYPELYPSLKQNIRYPFDQNSAIVTEPLLLMRNSDNYQLYDITSGPNYRAYFVSAAAPDLRTQNAVFNAQSVFETFVNVLVSPLIQFKFRKEETCIVLGAWGCGAFRNDPLIMSRLMKNALIMYGGNYGKIILGIPSSKGQNNYYIFKNTFSSLS